MIEITETEVAFTVERVRAALSRLAAAQQLLAGAGPFSPTGQGYGGPGSPESSSSAKAQELVSASENELSTVVGEAENLADRITQAIGSVQSDSDGLARRLGEIETDEAREGFKTAIGAKADEKKRLEGFLNTLREILREARSAGGWSGDITRASSRPVSYPAPTRTPDYAARPGSYVKPNTGVYRSRHSLDEQLNHTPSTYRQNRPAYHAPSRQNVEVPPMPAAPYPSSAPYRPSSPEERSRDIFGDLERKLRDEVNRGLIAKLKDYQAMGFGGQYGGGS